MRLAARGRFLPTLVLLLPVILLTVLFAVTTFDPNHNPHALFRDAQNCPKCHVAVAGKPDPDRFLSDSIEFCLGCHAQESLGNSHPIRTRPRDRFWKMKIPSDFRLDDDGRLMCLTCHSAHGPFLSKTKSFVSQKPENPNPPPGVPLYYKTRFVRLSDPARGWEPLCNGCHEL